MKKRTCQYILGLDPSGNFNEGKGKTGWVLMSVRFKRTIKFGEIDASTYLEKELYWKAIIDLILNLNQEFPELHVVVEDYFLYENKAIAQTNSRMETPQLIGVIKYTCYMHNIYIDMQTAASVKTRWEEKILVYNNYLQSEVENGRTKYYINNYHVKSDHTRDALKHAVHYLTFKVEQIKR